MYLQACLKFLRERTLPEARTDRQVGPGGISGQRPGPIVSLALETTHTFFKVCTLLVYVDAVTAETLQFWEFDNMWNKYCYKP